MMRDYPEIDLHGLFADEARERLEKAIADAIHAGHYNIRIIHGKGTGALRREVRDLLKYHPRVLTYQYASPHDGGEGATVAALDVKR
ncbi:MAG: Smr/MutS family protein [Dehalococcoidia bacterium]